MAARGWILNVSASLLLVLAGCTPSSFNLLVEQRLAGGETVAGSPAAVSFTAQAALSKLGLMASVNRDGETIRIDSVTPSGKKFHMLLVKVAGEQGSERKDQTVVHVKWENEQDADAAFWFEFLGALQK